MPLPPLSPPPPPHPFVFNWFYYCTVSHFVSGLYAQCIAGTRGVTAHFIVMEEAAYNKQDVFKKVVLPALVVEGTAFVAITTPGGEDNFVSQLATLKRPDGRPLLSLLMAGMACRRCMAAGKGADCTHKQTEMPPWKSSDRQKMIQTVLKNDQQTYLREAQGMIASSAMMIYRAYMAAFKTRKPYKFRNPPHLLFTYYDPAGFGNFSDHAMVTMGFENMRDVVRFVIICCIFVQFFYSNDTHAHTKRHRLMYCNIKSIVRCEAEM